MSVSKLWAALMIAIGFIYLIGSIKHVNSTTDFVFQGDVLIALGLILWNVSKKSEE